MNDELPTDERVRRIERGVQRRIGLRRRVAQRVAVGAAAVLLVAGGAALIRPVVGSVSSTSAGGSAAKAPETASAAASHVVVECHGARTATVEADAGRLPASALAACALAERGAATSDQHALSGSGATASAPTSTLCETSHGALVVYPGSPAVCATHGTHPYRG